MTARDTFDLTIARTIRAPRQKVFDAFIKPEHPQAVVQAARVHHHGGGA